MEGEVMIGPNFFKNTCHVRCKNAKLVFHRHLFWAHVTKAAGYTRSDSNARIRVYEIGSFKNADVVSFPMNSPVEYLRGGDMNDCPPLSYKIHKIIL